MLIRKIGRAAITTSLFTGLSLVLILVIQSFIGRTYGAIGVGLYATFMMFINMYSLLSIFGMPTGLSKIVAEYDEKGESRNIYSSVNSTLIFSILTSLLIGFLGFYFTPRIGKILHVSISPKASWIILITLIFFNFGKISEAFNQGLLKAFRSSLIKATAFMGILLMIIYSLFFKRIDIYYAIGIGYIIAGVLGLFLSVKITRGGFSKDLLFKIMKFSIPIALMSQLFFISQWIDRFALGVYMGVAEIGVFTAASNIIQGVLHLPMSLSLVLLPSYSKINIYGKDKLEKAFDLNLKVLTVFLYICSVLLYLFAEDIIYLLFASKIEEFKMAILVTKILSVNIALSAITIPIANLITGAGKPKFIAIISFIGVAIQTALILVLTKKFGIIGTAAGRGITLLIIVFMDVFVLLKFFKIKLKWLSVFSPLFACVGSIAVYMLAMFIFKIKIIAAILLGLSYALFVYRFILSGEDIRLLKKAFIGQKGID